MAHEVETMFYNFSERQTPWHGLGIPLNAPPTSADAIVAAGLNWEVVKKPIQTTDGILVPEQFANVRSTDGKPLGVVGKNYKIVQNIEAFDFVDHLLGEGVVYETAGSLFGGEKIWLLARLPEQVVLGDKVVPYLAFVNSHNGRGAIKVATTPIRVVCNNTLNIGLHHAARSFSTKHVGDIKGKLAAAQTALQLASTYMAGLREEAEKLAAKKITKEKFDEIAKVLLMPKDVTTPMLVARANERIAMLQARLQAPDLANIRDNGWGVLSAVSDYVTHDLPVRQTKTYKETLMDNAINGYSILDEAFTLLAAA